LRVGKLSQKNLNSSLDQIGARDDNLLSHCTYSAPAASHCNSPLVQRLREFADLKPSRRNSSISGDDLAFRQSPLR
jgi:hypothetical protein